MYSPNRAEQLYLKVLRYGLFLCAFTPLILYSQFLSIFHFPKVIVFRSIVEIMLIFYVLLIIGNKKYRPDWKNPLLIAVTVFTGLYILTSITGVNPYRSFWGTLERMGGVFTFIHYWVFFVILTSVFNNNANDANRNANDANRNANYANNSCAANKNWMKLLKFCVIAGFLSILYAYGQLFDLGEFFVGWQHGRIFGTQGNAALFAGYLIFILFLAAYLLFTEAYREKHRNIQKVFYGLVIALGVPALFLTAVRGSILSFIGALFLLAIFIIFFHRDTQTISQHKAGDTQEHTDNQRKSAYSSEARQNPRVSAIKIIALALLVLLLTLISVLWLCRNQSWVQENRYLKRITDISLETKTVQTRLATWKSAWQGWQERFWLGWGPENFNVLFAKHFDPMHYEGFGSEVVWDRAHNTFLDIGTTMGIVGLLSYLSIFIVLFFYLYKLIFNRSRRTQIATQNNADDSTRRRFSYAVLGAMFIAYIGHNISFFDTFNSYLMFFITIGYISFLSRKTRIVTQNDAEESSVDPRNYPREAEKFASIDKRRKAVAIILTPIVLLAIWKTAIIPAKANYAATRGIVYGRSSKYFPVAFDYFRKSLAYHPIQGEYRIRHELARVVFRVFSYTSTPEKFGVEREDLYFARNEVYKNIETDPLDPIPYLYAARVNEFISRVEQKEDVNKAKEMLDEAERLLNKAKELNSKNPYTYFELGQLQIFKGNLEEAIKYFDEGIKIRPEVKLGYWYKGVTLIDLGRIEEGEAMIKEAEKRGYKKNLSDINRLIERYIDLKDYPKLIELYKEAIELQPNNAQFYARLATAYKENGEIEKAIETAKKVGELDPKLKAEAEAWINMLKSQLKQ
ncbi:hypothetical protein DRN85_09500 [Methanosarcinales archaeon]|nr:MAG: hypothetical protein DRN85_09500 [Methanosarcinales archaeon]